MSVAVRRVVAWLIDWGCILVWVAVTAAVGVPLYLGGLITAVNIVALNLVGALVIVVPVVVAAAWCESRSFEATPGKRVMSLVVQTGTARVQFKIALLRNFLKLGLPWLIGHAAVFAIVASSSAHETVPTAVWVLTALAYIFPIVWVLSLFIGRGRTPYDRICGTSVTRGRRVS